MKETRTHDHSGLEDNFRAHRDQAGQFRSLFVVHADTASGNAFSDFAPVVVPVNPVEAAPGCAVGKMNLKGTHEI